MSLKQIWQAANPKGHLLTAISFLIPIVCGSGFIIAIGMGLGGFETIKVNGRYRVNSGEMAGRAAISGVGFAILSKQACQPYIDDGWLIEIEFEQSAAPLQLFALYSDRRYLPAKTRALIDFMHQRLSH